GVTAKALRTQVEAFRAAIFKRAGPSDHLFSTLARELYDELLRPAESQLKDSDSLLVVPDGPLHLLPFQALMRSENQFLVEWKPLSTVASATVYGELERRRNPETRPVELAAFGDPHYPVTARQHLTPSADVETRSAVQRGLSFSPLPFSRMEVN